MPFDVMAAVKWVAGLALALLLVLGGRSCGAESTRKQYADDLTAASEALTEAKDQLRGCATSLTWANEQVIENKRRADEQAVRAAEAVEEALRAGERYARELGKVDAELEAAKADPDCRRMLEMPACAALH